MKSDYYPYSRINLEKSLSAIRQQAKEATSPVQTNCLFPQKTLNEYAIFDRLQYMQNDSGLIFLGDEGSYYQLYYFLHGETDFPVFPHDKPLVVNELDAGGRRKQYIIEIEKRLFEAGFSLESNNLYLANDLKGNESRLRQIYLQSEEHLQKLGLFFSVPKAIREQDQIARLWREHLKPTDIPWQHWQFSSGETHCIFDMDGTVCAVIWWTCFGKTSEWRHIVTHPNHLRQGLAFALLSKWAVTALDSGCMNGFSWCEEHNIASLALQSKIGSNYSGRYCRQYINTEIVV